MSAIAEFIHQYPGSSKAFTVSASVGDVIVVATSCANNTTHATASDDKGNTYTERVWSPSAGGGAMTVLTTTVTTGGVITVTVSSLSDMGFSAFLMTGLNGTVDTSNTATGSGTTLSASITTTVSCAIFVFWGDESANDYTGMLLSYTQQNHDTGHYDASGYSLGVAAGTYSPGVSRSAPGATNGYIAVIAMQESGAASTTRGVPFGARGTAFNGGRTFMGLIR